MENPYMHSLFASKKMLKHAFGLLGLLLMSLANGVPVMAQETNSVVLSELPFAQRYPANSINSVERADQILDVAAKERALLDYRYIDDQRACYKHFFVSYCLENAKEHHRVLIKQIREIEAVANSYKRQSKADDRDKSLEEQRIKDEQDAARRLQDQQNKAASTALQLKDSAVKQQTVDTREGLAAGHENDRVKAHQAKLQADAADEAAKAPQRAANEEAYKEKVKAAQAHRLDVEAKKAAKEKERAAKKQQAKVQDTQSSPSVSDTPTITTAPSK